MGQVAGGRVSEQEFRRAFGYANSAMDLLKRAQIPPYPQFYELLYTYATGVNPTLNSRLNAITSRLPLQNSRTAAVPPR